MQMRIRTGIFFFSENRISQSELYLSYLGGSPALFDYNVTAFGAHRDGDGVGQRVDAFQHLRPRVGAEAKIFGAIARGGGELSLVWDDGDRGRGAEGSGAVEGGSATARGHQAYNAIHF